MLLRLVMVLVLEASSGFVLTPVLVTALVAFLVAFCFCS